MKVNKSYSFFISIVVSLGGFLFGFDASVISGVIGFVTPQFDLNVIAQGWVVSSPSFAAMFAMLVAGTLSDRVGRKKVLVMSAFLYALSALLSAVAPSYFLLVLARMIGGVAFGAALVIAPMYIGEISPAGYRGKLVAIQQLNIVLGFSVSYFSNFYLLEMLGTSSYFTEYNVWRWMLGVEFVPAAIYFALMFLVPRSPRWLLKQGYEDEAHLVLAKVFDEQQAVDEAAEIIDSLDRSQHQQKSRFTALFAPQMQVILVLGLVIAIVQQITGVNAIFFYATTIFEQSGVGKNAAFAQAIWVGLINIVLTLLAMTLIDKIGRKPLMLIGLAGVAVSMAVTAYGFHSASYELTPQRLIQLEKSLDTSVLDRMMEVHYSNELEFKTALKHTLGEKLYVKYESELIQASTNINPIIVLVGILGFVASFAFSLGPVMWVLFSEIFPNKIRGVAIAFFGFVNSATSTLVQFIFPWELANLGNAWSYFIFGLFAVIGFIILIKILPETKNKSLESIEKELVKS